MARSMTGFGYGKLDLDDMEIEIKARSVNGKGLDVSVKGDRDITFFLERDIRNKIKEHIERGNISIYINVKHLKPKLLVNLDNLKEAVKIVYKLIEETNVQLSGDKIFELANSISREEEREFLTEELKRQILELFDEVLNQLLEEKKKEGEKLVRDIEERLDYIAELIEKIDKEKDKIIEKMKDKLIEKVKELLGENYSERAFIEASMLVEKMDITEEIVRLKSHISRFKELLKQDKSVGKKLDFLSQEMHREINTLGNKIPDFSDYVIEIKAQIDKIRQQVANLE
jgi:uncharacterized protein (TIGR00255 family)